MVVGDNQILLFVLADDNAGTGARSFIGSGAAKEVADLLLALHIDGDDRGHGLFNDSRYIERSALAATGRAARRCLFGCRLCQVRHDLCRCAALCGCDTVLRCDRAAHRTHRDACHGAEDQRTGRCGTELLCETAALLRLFGRTRYISGVPIRDCVVGILCLSRAAVIGEVIEIAVLIVRVVHAAYLSFDRFLSCFYVAQYKKKL